MEIEKLFEPIAIRGMLLKNRIVMPAMASKLPDESGAVTDRMIDFYVARARGGVGLIITENTCIDWPTGKAAQNPLRIDDDKYIMGLNDLAEAVQFYGCRIATQPQHTGRQTSVAAVTEGAPLVSASDVPCLVTGGDVPRALSIEEIFEIENKFADAARRTKDAGMDCVEMHGAHGYLITQFMSPFTNKRSDLYGGSLENRMRFPLRIVEKARKAVGDFPIIFRLSADEAVQGGLTLEDTKNIAMSLAEAGVDALSISAGIYESLHLAIPGMGIPYGCHLKFAEAIKKVVDIPVIAVGKLGDPLLAEEVIRRGQADLVAMGRSLLADPDLPNKAREGRLDDIRPCIYCNQGCHGKVFRGHRLTCSVNAACGNEINFNIKPTVQPTKILVIGGGPGGIETALTAAARGHDVTLVEKNNRLGGKLLIACVPHFKKEIEPYIAYLENQIKKSDVKLELNTEATLATIEKFKPNAVVVATGAQRWIPDIPGIEAPHVLHAEDVISGAKTTGERVVIVGGNQIGCETAWLLGEQKKEVTLIGKYAAIGMDINPATMSYLSMKLREFGVNIVTESYPKTVLKDGITIFNKDWKEQKIEANTIVIATGYRNNFEFAESIKKMVSKVFTVGDYLEPASILEAVHRGSKLGRLIEELP